MSRNNNGNNENNSPIPGYPEEIKIEEKDLDFFLRVSEMLAGKHRFEEQPDTLILSRKSLFGGQRDAWQLFLTLFFPDKIPRRNKNIHSIFNSIFIRNDMDQIIVRSEGREEIEKLFDYLMIGRENYPAVYDYIVNHQLDIPAFRIALPKLPASMYLRQYSNNLGNLNNQPNENNFNNNNNNYPEMGYANSNEENLYGKLSSKNFKKYGKGGKRKTRKVKKSKSKTRKGKSRRAH